MTLCKAEWCRIAIPYFQLSKIEAQKMEIEVLPVDVKALINDVHSFTQVLADNKDIYFRTKCDHPIPKTIQTDPTR